MFEVSSNVWVDESESQHRFFDINNIMDTK
jgi:hypothetical protein